MTGSGRASSRRAAHPAPPAGVAFGCAFVTVAIVAVLGAGLAGAVLHDLSPRGQALVIAALAVMAAQLGFPLRALSRGQTVRDLLVWPLAVGLAAGAGLALHAGLHGRPVAPVLALAAAAAVLGAFFESLSRLLLDRGLEAPVVTGASALLLAVGGLTPVWMGPIAELHASNDRLASAVVGISPLSYLAAAAQHDYLREAWFYAHSSLGSLRFDYPDPVRGTAAWLLGAACLAALRRTRCRRIQARHGGLGE